MYFEDTITAISTPPGEGGIGIVRVSGSMAEPIIKKVFVTKNGKAIQEIKDRYFYYGKVLDDQEGVIDEVLMVLMRGPRSFTGEDVAEIHCHGGMIPVKQILRRIIGTGGRLAEPGEFTKRAFLNGRMDLAQAEAVMDLIGSKSEMAAKASIQQMEGHLSRKIKEIREKLLNVLAHIEVTVDYPEEDIDEVILPQLKERTHDIYQEIQKLLETAEQGKLIRQGIKTVIIGKPNVGKSSLLNALVRENRAIVTDVPGTTRDVIEEYINIKGIAVRIVDTAGIRETLDLVEKIGVERSKENIKDADLLILILDASNPLSKEDMEILGWIKDKKTLILLNKIDRPVIMEEQEIGKLAPSKTVIKTSFTDGTGLQEIEDFIYQMVFKGGLSVSDDILINNIRHQEALMKAGEHLQESSAAMEAQIPLDLVSIDIRGAWEALGSITGESFTENLIDKIFSEFCLGK